MINKCTIIRKIVKLIKNSNYSAENKAEMIDFLEEMWILIGAGR